MKAELVFLIPGALGLLWLVSICAAGQAASAPASPATLILDGDTLQATRQRVQAGDPAIGEAIAQLHRQAERAMQGKLWTVTDKPMAPPSGDKHDYVSLASYFWPDPKSPTGLPYVSRDGELNPEILQYDRYRLEPMVKDVETLALDYYFSGRQDRAERAAMLLRTWFLDEKTKMNPHLKYAQMINGKNEGSPFGIIETGELTRVVDAVALLQGSPAWTAKDDQALRQWFSQYLDWLLTSEPGRKEGKAPNNHGTFYDVQTADFALFLGKKDLARQILEAAKTRRIAAHIQADGTQPQELRRTKARSYTELNLQGMFLLARLGEHVDLDLWRYKTDDGRGIKLALDWLLPFLNGEKDWSYPQITRERDAKMVYVLRNAAAVYRDDAYEKVIAHLTNAKGEILQAELLYPAK